MKTDVYSEKEILIMESLLVLRAKGLPLHSIKVSDIAAEAGIGKGTLYEYFSSKEEIISCAVIYSIEKELLSIIEIIRKAESFHHCTTLVLEKMIACEKDKTSSLILMSPDVFTMEEVAKIFDKVQEIYGESEQDLISEYLALGVKEGIFPPIQDTVYAQQVVTSMIAGFHTMIHIQRKEDPHKLIQNCYDILVKALQPM